MWNCKHNAVVVCPLQPFSSANLGCPGPESSVPVASWLACLISSHVTRSLGWRTSCGHQFHSLDNLKNHFASIAFCRNTLVCNIRNGAVIELSFVASIKSVPRHWWVEVDCLVPCYPSYIGYWFVDKWGVKCMKCVSCCLLAVVTRFDNIWWRLSPSFPLVIYLGDVVTNVLCIQALYQILHREKI